jgi:antitoxin component YwqK of YwqJK toxin-antitoxin module
MKNMLLFCLVLCGFGISAQSAANAKDAQGRRHGLWEKLHDNGKTRYSGRFEHGTPVDTFKYYFFNGQLQTVNIFRGKSGVCWSTQFGEKKILAAEGLYRKNQKDSIWTYYNQAGKVIAREIFVAGVRHGQALKYHPNGKVAESVIYIEGSLEGEWVQYYDSGKRMSEGTYHKNELHGEVTYFFSSGKPRSRGSYASGLMNGVWYFFTSDLKLDHKEDWSYGRKIEDGQSEVTKDLEIKED